MTVTVIPTVMPMPSFSAPTPPASLPPATGRVATAAPPAAALRAEQVEAGLDRLPPLPAVLRELIELMAQDGVGAQRLGAVLARDPALTMTTLRLANSSFYGVSRQVATVSEAVCVLGLRNLRGLVTTAALASAFPPRLGPHFDALAFWRHALTSATGARALALAIGADDEAAFTLGLLHDFGQLAMAMAFPAQWAALEAERAATLVPPGTDPHAAVLEELATERRHFGVDHAEVGAMLTARWQLAAWFVDAIRQHHAPSVDARLDPPLAARQGPSERDTAVDWPVLLQLTDLIGHWPDDADRLATLDALSAHRRFGLDGAALQSLACQAADQAAALCRSLLE